MTLWQFLNESLIFRYKTSAKNLYSRAVIKPNERILQAGNNSAEQNFCAHQTMLTGRKKKEFQACAVDRSMSKAGKNCRHRCAICANLLLSVKKTDLYRDMQRSAELRFTLKRC